MSQKIVQHMLIEEGKLNFLERDQSSWLKAIFVPVTIPVLYELCLSLQCVTENINVSIQYVITYRSLTV